MATTQIKDGFNGGTDNQLLVNPDGSINVNGGGGGGTSNVNLHDGSGNAINSSNGALDVTFANGFNGLSPGSPGQIAVGITSTLLFAANPIRKYAHIANNSGQPIYIQYASAAALNQGVKIPPNGFFTIESNNLWLGSINAIGVMTNQLIDVLEGE